MGRSFYEAARAGLIAEGGLWTALIGGLALAAIAVALIPAAGGRRGRAAIALAAALWAGWVRLAMLHAAIGRAVRVPALEAVAAGVGPPKALAVPLWIEGEKLYAWACLLAVALIVIWGRRDDRIFAWGLAALGALALAAVALSSPFTDPLPGLHAEVGRYFAAAGDGFPGPDWTSRMGDAQVRAAVQEMWARATFYYNTAYMWIHPPALFVSYAAFVMSFISCVLLLATRAVRYDRIAYDYAKFGYLVLTAGMLIGYPWAVLAWKGESWWWSGKINMSIMMWVLYSAYLHSRLYLARRGMWRLAGWLGVVCFATLVMTYLSTYLVPGAHSVAQP